MNTKPVTFTVLRNANVIQISAKLATGTTREGAAQIVARFPKALKLIATTWSDGEGNEGGYVALTISLKATKANGGSNEAGLARYAKFVQHANKLGLALVSHPWSTEAIA